MFGMFPVGFSSGTPTIPAAVISGFHQVVQTDTGMVFRWSNAATYLDFFTSGASSRNGCSWSKLRNLGNIQWFIEFPFVYINNLILFGSIKPFLDLQYSCCRLLDSVAPGGSPNCHTPATPLERKLHPFQCFPRHHSPLILSSKL